MSLPQTRRCLLVALALLLSGCAQLSEWKQNGFKVGPNYRRPCAPYAPAWIDGNAAEVSPECRQMINWWTVFGDPTLEQLVLAAYQQNLSVRAAGLRVLQAREQLGIAAMNLFPQAQTFSSQYARNQISTTTANVFPGVARSFDDLRAGFDLSWELDIWGRIRRSIEASEAALDAEIETYDDVLVTLIGDVAASYIELRSFDERLQLADQNAKIQEGSLKIAQARQREGRVSELDVEQAKTNLADTRALIPSLRQGRRLALNRLAILLGTTPFELEPLLSARGNLPNIPEEVVLGVPADLLRRRPDVRAAERGVAARSAQIGVAEADLYPQFALTGQIGINAESWGDLFSSASAIGTVAPGVRWNVFNYGRLKKNVRVRELQFQESIVNYQNIVLAAHREVEDGLVQFLESKKRLAELRTSAEASAKSVDLVQIQYKEGEVDFGRVFVVESALVQRQDQLIATEAEVAVALIRTYKALGGGWQLRLDTPYEGRYELSMLNDFELREYGPFESMPGPLDKLQDTVQPLKDSEDGWNLAEPAEPQAVGQVESGKEGSGTTGPLKDVQVDDPYEDE